MHYSKSQQETIDAIARSYGRAAGYPGHQDIYTIFDSAMRTAAEHRKDARSTFDGLADKLREEFNQNVEPLAEKCPEALRILRNYKANVAKFVIQDQLRAS